jgi:hypothetical protein
LRPLRIEVAAKHLQQRGGAKGLGTVRVRPSREGSLLGLGSLVRGQHHHRPMPGGGMGAELPIEPDPVDHVHDPRHTAASLMIAQGASLQEVKGTLGHSLIAVTSNTCSHLYDQARQQIADRMDEAFPAGLRH